MGRGASQIRTTVIAPELPALLEAEAKVVRDVTLHTGYPFT